MATLATGCRLLLLCLLSFSIAMSRPSAQAASPPLPLPQPHLPHIPHSLGDPPSGYSMNSHIIISALGILFVIVFTIVVLHMYAKWCWWRRAHLQQRMLAQLHAAGSNPAADDPAKPCGLDKHIVSALPTFSYSPTRPPHSAAIASKPAECAVCLADFHAGDACKLLPKCQHFFHIHCIDIWFLSNATCPLCRATPALLDEEAAHASATGASDEQCQEARTGIWLKHDAGTGGERDGQDDLALLSSGISVQARRWKRSLSDKLLGAANRDALSPGSHGQASPRPPMVWERSASYSTIDSLRDAESLVELSSRHCASSSGSPRAASHHHHHPPPPVYHPPLGGPKSLLRVFSK